MLRPSFSARVRKAADCWAKVHGLVVESVKVSVLL
jgi:hypothetical protein